MFFQSYNVKCTATFSSAHSVYNDKTCTMLLLSMYLKQMTMAVTATVWQLTTCLPQEMQEPHLFHYEIMGAYCTHKFQFFIQIKAQNWYAYIYMSHECILYLRFHGNTPTQF